jgi:hypothetical protein
LAGLSRPDRGCRCQPSLLRFRRTSGMTTGAKPRGRWLQPPRWFPLHNQRTTSYLPSYKPPGTAVRSMFQTGISSRKRTANQTPRRRSQLHLARYNRCKFDFTSRCKRDYFRATAFSDPSCNLSEIFAINRSTRCFLRRRSRRSPWGQQRCAAPASDEHGPQQLEDELRTPEPRRSKNAIGQG